MIAKVTVLLAIALFTCAAMRRASAATRHAVLLAAQIAALALPLLMAIVPPLRVAAPESIGGAGDFTIPRLLATLTTTTQTRVDWLAAIWIGIALLIAAARALAFLRARAIVARAMPMPVGGYAISSELDHPAAFGQSIILPRESLGWSDALRHAVLLHERAHAERRDTLAQLVAELTCALYWFHPLAWLVRRQAALERERACDDFVLRAGVEACDYASALVAIARRASRRTAMALAAAETTHLERRVRALLDAATPRRMSRATLAAIVICTVATVPALAALTPALLTSVARPASGEPDRLQDEITSFASERPPAPVVVPVVAASGPDAVLIEVLTRAAMRAPHHEVDLVPERARWSLTQVRGGELVTPLIERTRDADWRIRSCAAWALGVSNDRRGTAALIALLGDDIWRVRAMAAAALSATADPVAREAMLRRIDDPAWQVRSSVVDYLGALGDPSLAALIAAMLDDRHIAVRLSAEEALDH